MAELKHQNELLEVEKKLVQKKAEAYDADALNKTIEFISENKSEKLSLLIREIIFIKSADNYAEVRYLEGDRASKKLVRNTLRNIELQLSPHPEFVRCHRICIVNIHHIEKLNGTNNHHTVTIKGYDKPIPVSRQYYIKMKEALLTA